MLALVAAGLSEVRETTDMKWRRKETFHLHNAFSSRFFMKPSGIWTVAGSWVRVNTNSNLADSPFRSCPAFSGVAAWVGIVYMWGRRQRSPAHLMLRHYTRSQGSQTGPALCRDTVPPD